MTRFLAFTTFLTVAVVAQHIPAPEESNCVVNACVYRGQGLLAAAQFATLNASFAGVDLGDRFSMSVKFSTPRAVVDVYAVSLSQLQTFTGGPGQRFIWMRRLNGTRTNFTLNMQTTVPQLWFVAVNRSPALVSFSWYLEYQVASCLSYIIYLIVSLAVVLAIIGVVVFVAMQQNKRDIDAQPKAAASSRVCGPPYEDTCFDRIPPCTRNGKSFDDCAPSIVRTLADWVGLTMDIKHLPTADRSVIHLAPILYTLALSTGLLKWIISFENELSSSSYWKSYLFNFLMIRYFEPIAGWVIKKAFLYNHAHAPKPKRTLVAGLASDREAKAHVQEQPQAQTQATTAADAEAQGQTGNRCFLALAALFVFTSTLGFVAYGAYILLSSYKCSVLIYEILLPFVIMRFFNSVGINFALFFVIRFLALKSPSSSASNNASDGDGDEYKQLTHTAADQHEEKV